MHLLRTPLLSCLAICVLHGSSAASGVRVGLSRADITPPEGGLTRGYSAAKPTNGIHDRLSATVMILETDEECLALVACDLCAYNSPDLHSGVADIGVDRLLILNSHTHSGPKLSQLDFPSEKMPWKDVVDRRILAAIKEAKAKTFAASFTAASGHLQLGYNRLVREGDFAVTRFENPHRVPYGSVDPTVGVIRVTDNEQRPRAVLINYACHPVILGPKNQKISADYPGVVREIVEQRLGDDCLCLFIQGAAGDINPLMMARGDNRDQDFDVVRAMGELLAAEVMQTLDTIGEPPSTPQSLKSSSFLGQFRNRWDASEQLTLGATTVLINNEIALLSMPGEPFHTFQLDFRARSGVPHAFLFGYACNGSYDWPKYLPDIVSAARGGYGASDATVAEVGAGERLINEGLVLLFNLQGRLKSEPRRHTFEREDSR